jgi:hypothetical protein
LDPWYSIRITGLCNSETKESHLCQPAAWSCITVKKIGNVRSMFCRLLPKITLRYLHARHTTTIVETARFVQRLLLQPCLVQSIAAATSALHHDTHTLAMYMYDIFGHSYAHAGVVFINVAVLHLDMYMRLSCSPISSAIHLQVCAARFASH